MLKFYIGFLLLHVYIAYSLISTIDERFKGASDRIQFLIAHTLYMYTTWNIVSILECLITFMFVTKL